MDNGAAGPTQDDRYERWSRRIKESALFLFGGIGLVHEFFILPEPRPVALFVWCGLLGFPFAGRADDLFFRRKTESQDE